MYTLLFFLLLYTPLKSADLELTELDGTISSSTTRNILNSSLGEEDLDHLEEEDLDLLACFVSKNLNLEDPLVHLYITKKNILQILPVLLGSVCGLPLSCFAKKAAGDNVFFQYVLVSSTILSVGITRMWAISNIVGEIQRERDELVLKSNLKRYCKHITTNVLGFASSLPNVYAVYKFSDNYLYTLITLCSEYSLATYGYYEIYDDISLEKIKRTPRKAFYGQPLNQLETDRKEKWAALFDRASIEILGMKETEYNEFERNLKDCLLSSSSFSLTSLQEILEALFISEDQNQFFFSPKSIYRLLFNVIPLSNFIVNAVLSYKSSQEVSESLFFSVPYIILTTVPPFVIGMIAANATATDIYDEYFINKTNKRSFLKNAYPNVNIVTNILAVILASGATSWGIQLCKQALDDSSLSQASIFFAATCGAGVLILESFAIRDFITDISISYSQYFGDNLKKKKIYIAKQFSKIGQDIRNMAK